MRVLPFTIPKPTNDTILFQEDIQDVFYNLLHQHEEIQISYIVAGNGSVLVGDSVTHYKAGDIFVIGSNLPHVFKSDTNASMASHMQTVFFLKEAFGADFFNTEELLSLRSFFKKASNGFKISNAPIKTSEYFKKIKSAKGVQKFLLFLDLLENINKKSSEILASFISTKKYSELEGSRMSSVIDYTLKNYQNSISLSQISKEAAMTTNAFCKYFKKRTRKTYINFLNEIRIEAATKALQQQPDLSISHIAEQSGYQNISYFNRKFKEVKGVSPNTFRKLKVVS